jgi:glyoxylase-like metal-dependent hydrolase (beta-lactamase superfamily II)
LARRRGRESGAAAVQSRRRRHATPLVAALLLAVPALAADSGPPVIEIAAGVHFVPGGFVRGSQPDGNSVVFEAPEGLVMVDTGRHPAHAQRLLDLATGLGRPVAAIVNTHWHLDHIGGNTLLREKHPAARLHATGAIVSARQGFLARYRGQLESMIADARPTAEEKAGYRAELARIAGSAALDADVLVADDGAPAAVAGRPLELHVAPGATEADLWLFDPATRVLVAGDLVTLPAPFFDTACPARWQASLARLASVELTTLVPGHGPPLDRAGFDRYRRAFDGLLACAGSDAPAEACIAGWLADAGPLVGAEETLARDLLRYYLDNVLRDPARRSCG